MTQDEEPDFPELAGVLIRRAPAAPPDGHEHVDDDELWGAAAYNGATLSASERTSWNRILECADCFNRLAAIRHALNSPEITDPTGWSSIESLRAAWHAQVLQVFRIELAKESLLLMIAAVQARKRLRVRASVRGSGGAPPPHVDSEVMSVTTETDDFAIAVSVSDARQADGARGARCSLTVRATPKYATASTQTLVARLRHADTPLRELGFEGRTEVVFSDVDVASYQIEILRMA